MKRHTFLKYTFQAGALTVLSRSLGNNFFQQDDKTAGRTQVPKDPVFKRIILANDRQVQGLMNEVQSGKMNPGRQLGFDFALLAASFSCKDSSFYHNKPIIPALEKLIDFLAVSQTSDGTLNFSNPESPPDTAFLLEPLIASAKLLSGEKMPELELLLKKLRKFLLKAGEALATGGVHTPNHRWLICGVLARLNNLYPDERYTQRIDDWLGEGVYIDEDGHYPERSVNYAVVENNGLIAMGRLLNRPLLFEPVKKNLGMTWFYMEPNGDLVSTDSRRQDQYGSKNIVPYYLHFRFFAVRDKNRQFAAIARLMEQMKGFEEQIAERQLFHFMDNPVLQEDLPPLLPLENNFEKLFPSSGLLRIRRDDISATFFGGVDWPLIISSGRSNSPNFFSYRKGEAILKYVRLSVAFFDMGYFYSEGLTKKGNRYALHKKNEVPYYQPLPETKRNPSGDYALTPSTDGRFWNKMDFPDRPISNIKSIETTITLTEIAGSCELAFGVNGHAGLRVTIELCFDEKGGLSGITNDGQGNHFLETGMGAYIYGHDTIRFGPGANIHKITNGLEGEMYSSHFGNLRTAGTRVFITGITPFSHKLTFS